MESIQQIAVRHALARRPVAGHVGLNAGRNAEQGRNQLPCPATVQADGRALAKRTKQLSGAIVQNGIDAQQPVSQRPPSRSRGGGIQPHQAPQGGPGFRMCLDGQPPAVRLQKAVQIGQPHTGLNLDHPARAVKAGSAGEMGGGIDQQAGQTATRRNRMPREHRGKPPGHAPEPDRHGQLSRQLQRRGYIIGFILRLQAGMAARQNQLAPNQPAQTLHQPGQALCGIRGRRTCGRHRPAMP